jgi:hypothetical protein
MQLLEETERVETTRLRNALGNIVHAARIQVVDDADNHLIGTVYDLTSSWVRILGRFPLPIGWTFHLRVLGAEIAGRGLYFSALSFDLPSPEARERLKELRDLAS